MDAMWQGRSFPTWTHSTSAQFPHCKGYKAIQTEYWAIGLYPTLLKICQQITKYQCTITAPNNPSSNKAERRAHGALERFTDKIDTVDTRTADQIQMVGAKLSSETKNIAAGLGKEIKNVSNQCNKIEIILSSIAKNKRPKLGGKMKMVGDVITNKLTQLV